MENVHIALFSAMTGFFWQSFLVAMRGKNLLSKWQSAETLRLRTDESEISDIDPNSQDDAVKKGQVTNEFNEFYNGLRSYFIKQILLWQSTNPLRWHSILERLHIENDDRAPDKVQEQLERPFVFCKYTGYCMEDGIFDFIEVAPATWLGFLVALGA